jgi:hypothetical protein
MLAQSEGNSPKQHQRSNKFFKSDAFNKKTVHMHRYSFIVDLRFHPEDNLRSQKLS